ncbi:MAG: MC/SLC25 family protein [Gammaproteobacteria bacterium]
MSHSRHEQKETQPEPAHKKNHPGSLVVGPGIAALSELAVFHPLDTISKRLQNHKEKIAWDDKEALNKVIFSTKYQDATTAKIGSLYNGFKQAIAYKALQRIYKFGGQPLVKSTLRDYAGDEINAVFGKKYGKVMLDGFAGSLIGMGEVALLPLDLWKIRNQNNVTEKMNPFDIYRGSLITMARNGIGSFALFGGSAFTKEMFELKNHHDASVLQEFAGASVGSVLSVALTNPADVIKTRIQTSSGKETAGSVVKHIVTNEGLHAFTKGMIPKVAAVAPKVAFSMTAANVLIKKCDETVTRLGLFATPPKEAATDLSKSSTSELTRKP